MMDSVVHGVVFGALGLVLGPVVGIVVDRAVERVPVRPEHRCPTCEQGLGSGSLLPIIGGLRRCRPCGDQWSWRYPIVDFLTVVVLALIGMRFGFSWVVAPYLGFGLVAVALTVIDAETHLLPNVIVWPSIWASLFAIMTLSGFNDYSAGIAGALAGGAVAGGLLGIAHLVYEPGMGRGDVKLALLLGLFVGWPYTDWADATRASLWMIILALMVVGFGGALINLIRYRSIRGAEVPFGPALIGASLLILVGSTGTGI